VKIFIYVVCFIVIAQYNTGRLLMNKEENASIRGVLMEAFPIKGVSRDFWYKSKRNSSIKSCVSLLTSQAG